MEFWVMLIDIKPYRNENCFHKSTYNNLQYLRFHRRRCLKKLHECRLNKDIRVMKVGRQNRVYQLFESDK